MNICFISGNFGSRKCGVGHYSLNLCSELVNIDYIRNIEVITGKFNDIYFASDKLKVKKINKWGVCNNLKLIKYLKTQNFDIIHVQYPTKEYGYSVGINFIPLIMKMVSNKSKTILTLHEFSFAHFLRKASIIPLLLGADKVIVTTQQEKNSIANIPLIGGSILKKISVIPIGSNIPSVIGKSNIKINDESLLRFLKDAELKLSYFGFIREDKGVEYLIKALSYLRNNGINAKLIMICELDSNNAYHRKISNLINRYKVKEYIYFTGNVLDEDVAIYLKLSDICVLPFSDGVTFRRGSFLAAISNMVPVITTYKDRLPESLENNNNLFALCNGNNSDLEQSLGDLILRIYKNEQLLRKVARNAYELSKKYSWRYIAKKNAELYK